jgi:hypothetical protein
MNIRTIFLLLLIGSVLSCVDRSLETLATDESHSHWEQHVSKRKAIAKQQGFHQITKEHIERR